MDRYVDEAVGFVEDDGRFGAGNGEYVCTCVRMYVQWDGMGRKARLSIDGYTNTYRCIVQKI